jgi:hypothetical protein
MEREHLIGLFKGIHPAPGAAHKGPLGPRSERPLEFQHRRRIRGPVGVAATIDSWRAIHFPGMSGELLCIGACGSANYAAATVGPSGKPHGRLLRAKLKQTWSIRS